MSTTKKLLRKVVGRLQPHRQTELKIALPEQAYNEWSADYDDQPENLILSLDEKLFESLSKKIKWQDAHVLDVGCGTGRHWPTILKQSPVSLLGLDISEGMLNQLQKKFPQADTRHMSAEDSLPVENNRCDVIVSTLTLAHISNAEHCILEWGRVLKNGGYLLLTDYHPDLLAKGGERTFRKNDRTVAVKSYVHGLHNVRNYLSNAGFAEAEFLQLYVDDSVKDFYVRQHAVHVYEKYCGFPLIYGMLAIKK